MTEHAEALQAVVIIPSSGGRFLVKAGGRTLFDKAEAARFPRQGEVAKALTGLL